MIASACLLAGAVFYSGYRYGTSTRPSPQGGPNAPTASLDLDLFWEALDVVKEKYVRIEKVDEKDFLYGAIQGAIGALDDPYSSFMPPDDAKKFDEDIRGNFGGIGAEIGKRDGQLIVIAPLKDSPAERAGLEPNDAIIKIDGKFSADKTVEEAVKIIRGEIGTSVKLLVGREAWDEPKEIAIKRGLIIVPTLEWKMIERETYSQNGRRAAAGAKRIAYIQIFNFNANAGIEFSKAAQGALLAGADGIVIDVRNNPGGFLEVATDIAGWLLDRGDTVVQERFRSKETRALVARGPSALARLPVAVIVNSGSASAAEILAGALRDNRGAKLIGEKTFGKGSVQELEDLRDGSTIKITTAEWLTPAGHSINETGIEPDIKVKKPETDGKKAGSDGDPYLEKALEVLTQ